MILDKSASCRVLVLNCEKIDLWYILTSTVFPYKRTIQLTPCLDLFSPLVIFWIYLQRKIKSSKDGFGICLFQSFAAQLSYAVLYSEILVTIVLHCDIFNNISRIYQNQKTKGHKIRCEHIKQGERRRAISHTLEYHTYCATITKCATCYIQTTVYMSKVLNSRKFLSRHVLSCSTLSEFKCIVQVQIFL